MTSPNAGLEYQFNVWQQGNELHWQAGHRTIWLMNNNMQPEIQLGGFLEGTYGDNCNAPGDLKLVLPGDHPAVDFLIGVNALASRDLHYMLEHSMYVVVETEHYRVAYTITEVELNTTHSPAGEEFNNETVTIYGIGLWEHINHIVLWANPQASLNVQLRYSDVQAGDSLRVIKSFLIRNLAREFGSRPNMDSAPPTRPGGFFSGFRPRPRPGQPEGPGRAWDIPGDAWGTVNQSGWPIMVNPINASEATEWTVLDSRFNNAGDVFKNTLNAAGLLLTVDLWLPGDKQPFPTHTKLNQPTIIIDVVPRSFQSGATGTARDTIRGLRAKIAGDSVTNAIVLDNTAFTGKNPHAWCVWDSTHMRDVETRLVVRKATDSTVIVGGRSPQIVNHLVAAGSNALWSGIGAAIGALFPPLAGLAAAAGTFIGNVQGNLLKDKLFAWNIYHASARADRLGPYRYRCISRPGEAWSLSSLQAGFTALQETKGAVSTEFTCRDGQPYVLGRDFRVGDQGAVRTHGILFATYVDSWQVNVRRGHDDVVLGLGDPRLRESPERALDQTLKTVSGVIDRVKTVIL